jgi:hypothetical protein
MAQRAQEIIKRAQDMFHLVQDGVRTTLRVVADLAESVGVPSSVTSLIQRGNGADAASGPEEAPPPPAPPTAPPTAPPVEASVEPAPSEAEERHDATGKRAPAKRRALVGDRERSRGVRQLEVDDAINGSTYLARIIWSLGVAQLEGIGALRPADIARMVMSRSAVSLEPPNVARYIRRSKPTTISVDRNEGGSNFYKLNAKGKQLFERHFMLN